MAVQPAGCGYVSKGVGFNGGVACGGDGVADSALPELQDENRKKEINAGDPLFKKEKNLRQKIQLSFPLFFLNFYRHVKIGLRVAKTISIDESFFLSVRTSARN